MDDMIKRQDAIDAIVNTISDVSNHDNSESARFGSAFRQLEIIEILQALPSAGPVQKTGKWKLLHKGKETSDYECTNCRGILMDVANDDHHELQRFCGMCGARMVGEEE